MFRFGSDVNPVGSAHGSAGFAHDSSTGVGTRMPSL
jgi:hypothetical protein